MPGDAVPESVNLRNQTLKSEHALANRRLIAIMLGRLKMKIEECIDVYISMIKGIFGRKIHSSPINYKLQI